MGRNRGQVRLEELRAQAIEMAEERAKRTPAQQLSVLDGRLGVGIGATKERARLQELIDNPPRPKKEKKNGSSTK